MEERSSKSSTGKQTAGFRKESAGGTGRVRRSPPSSCHCERRGVGTNGEAKVMMFFSWWLLHIGDVIFLIAKFGKTKILTVFSDI